VLVEVQQVQFVDLARQVPKLNMQIVPQQIDKMVPQFVECQVGVAALTVKKELMENVIQQIVETGRQVMVLVVQEVQKIVPAPQN
jgi:hypothetical protein